MRKIGFATMVASVVACAIFFRKDIPAILTWVQSLGSIAPIFFLLLYCLATILFLPTMLLTLAGGALFGPVFGTCCNLLGATLGAVCAFCISRYFAYNWLTTKKNVRLCNLIAGIEKGGWQCVALLRLLPIVPFNLVNYGLGVTRIKFSHYWIATLIFLIPTEILFTYFGYTGINLLSATRSLYQHALPLIGVSIVFILYLFLLRHHFRLYFSNMPKDAR